MHAKLKTRNVRQRVNVARYIAMPQRRLYLFWSASLYDGEMARSAYASARGFVFYCINQRGGRS